MPKIVCPMLINAEAEEIGCGEFVLENLKAGDEVKLLQPIGLDSARAECRIAVWVRVTAVTRHPLREREHVTGEITEVLDLGESDLEKGQTIRFGKCNIVQVA